jgi:hypothetical protein
MAAPAAAVVVKKSRRVTPAAEFSSGIDDPLYNGGEMSWLMPRWERRTTFCILEASQPAESKVLSTQSKGEANGMRPENRGYTTGKRLGEFWKERGLRHPMRVWPR